MTRPQHIGTRETMLSRVRAYDRVLRRTWLDRLRRHVMLDRKDKLAWYRLDQKPRTFIEQAIRGLHAVVRPGPQCVGAEYWMRTQRADTGFAFHFDRDEAIRAWVSSPRLASILYLSDVGGPTLILDALPTNGARPTRGVAVLPRRGRYVIFPGALLHGVQAGGASRWPRVAFFVNWWDQKPAAASDRASFALRRLSPPLRGGTRQPLASRASERPQAFTVEIS
jgi:hypothetical protein